MCPNQGFRQTDTTPRKAGHPSHISIATTKKCRSLLEINCSQGETALCCAVLALSGTDTLVSLIPRPVPGHQRLDDRRSPLGASQHKKKTTLVVSPEERQLGRQLIRVGGAHHDVLHQRRLTVLCTWRKSTVCKTPCRCSIGFLN